ncbi:MAG: serine/threonine protein kinase [Candidatus Hydrogenedentes bacterium]|nr:serine/threonine protein kinase [Candidatus Hydrogenedentota bacterium]
MWPFKKIFGNNKTAVVPRAEDFVEEGSLREETQSTLELTEVGPYEIIAPIGTGGMGTVYKAIDRERDQTVAIKVLDRRYDLDKKRRKRDYLGREILVAGELNHENIIKYQKDIIEQEDSLGHIRRCLVMEYIDGHNLRKHIVDRDLSIQQMIDLCIKLCHGLDFLHQKGIVHRDIKPQNFLFSRDTKQVKICDFGLSKSTASWRTRWIKEGGGTRQYMSPEQLAKRNLDARSDIFSFGITMYELFTGRHPCTGNDANEIMRQIRSKNYKFEPPSKHNSEVPPQLDRIVLKALRRSPENRYQSVTEMLLDLTRMAESRI